MNIKRIVAYSITAFLVSLSCTYAFCKKVLHWQAPYEDNFRGHIERVDDAGTAISDEWVNYFKANAREQKAPIQPAVIDTVLADPRGEYFYYTKRSPKPRNFSDELDSFTLYRCSIDGKSTDPVIELGASQENPFYFGDQGKLYVRRMLDDTDADTIVTWQDQGSVWRCGAKGESPEQICSIPKGMHFLGVTVGEKGLFLSTRNSETPAACIVSLPSKKTQAVPDGYEIAFAMHDARTFILSQCKPEKPRSFWTYDLDKGGVSEIPIDSGFLQQGQVSLVHMKDIRGQILYLQRRAGLTADGTPDPNAEAAIYCVDLDEKPGKDGHYTPVRLSPAGETAQFFTSSRNMYVFFLTGKPQSRVLNVMSGLKAITPIPLLNLGAHDFGVQFSESFEFLTFIRTTDTDGDGLVLSSKDLSEVFYLKSQPGQR